MIGCWNPPACIEFRKVTALEVSIASSGRDLKKDLPWPGVPAPIPGMIQRFFTATRTQKYQTSRGLRWLTAAACVCAASLSAAPNFEPQTPILIRPFGDSITYGVGYWSAGGACPIYGAGQIWCPPAKEFGGGYRAWLTATSLGTEQMPFRTEGRQHGNSNQTQWATATDAHDGYPGFRTDQLLPISQALSFSDATLVHVGTNDFLQSKSVDDAFENLVAITENLLTKNKKTHVFVARIIPVTAAAASTLAKFEPPTTPQKVNEAIGEYNQRIATDLIKSVQANISDASTRVTIVDMGAILYAATDYSDGIHPNMVGYSKMACVWQKAIYSAEPPCPVGSPAQIEKEFLNWMRKAGFPGPFPGEGAEDFMKLFPVPDGLESSAPPRRARIRSRR
ncbi:MAG: GDSL-type esterase/lipase family protein [bacterium]|nr:GDSL-type esterase/lipase family protein [bacterium]